MQQLNKKVLVLSAHPDDHLCCAGTLMYLRDKGFSLGEVVFTGGERSIWLGNSTGGGKIDEGELQKCRKSELSKASQLIGIERTSFLGLPDSGVVRSMELIDRIIGMVRQERPQILITQNPADYHHDHREVGRISTEAIDRAAWSISQELGEPYRVPIVLYMEGSYFGRSDVLVDVSKYAQRKEGVCAAYSSQMGERGRKLLKAMNSYRGYYKRSSVAECFEIAKDLPVYFNELMEVFSDVN